MIKALTIGLLLKATDQASGPVKGLSREVGKIGSEADVSASKMSRLAAPIKAVASTLNRIGVEAEAAARKVKPLTDKLDKLKDYGKEFAEHTLVPGAVMAGSLGYTVKDYSDLEAARNSLVVGMMEKGGKVDRQKYAGLSGLAEELGKDYMGSSQDFYKTFRVLIEQGISAEKILGGVGKSVADFSAVTGEAYDTAAFKLAKFHDGLGVAAGDMPKFAEQASKARFAFGLNTEELYTALPYMTAGLKALKIQGLEGADTVLRLSGIMARAGIPASEIGTSIGQVVNRMADFSLKLGKNSKVMREIRGILNGTGIEMNFWDKKGNFLGPENMIAQFEKLNRLTPQRRMEVQKHLFGDVGGRAVSILGDGGVKGWRESEQMMQRQATLGERVTSIQTTLAFKWDSFTGTVKTFRAEIGEAVSNSIFLKGALDGLNDTFAALTTWMREHKTIAGIIAGGVVAITGLLITLGVVGATIAGVAKFASFAIGGWARGLVLLRYLMVGLRVVTLALGGPWGWLAMAIVAAAVFVYKHWSTVKAVLIGVWTSFKGLLSAIWPITKGFFGAGATIATMLWKGIVSMAHKPVEAIKGIVQKIRNHLPFSPAKEGPLRDIHRIKLIETIADTIKPAPLIRSMRAAMGAALLTLPIPTASMAGNVGQGGLTLHYAPQITVQGGGPEVQTAFARMLQEHSRELERMIEQIYERKARRSF